MGQQNIVNNSEVYYVSMYETNLYPWMILLVYLTFSLSFINIPWWSYYMPKTIGKINNGYLKVIRRYIEYLLLKVIQLLMLISNAII